MIANSDWAAVIATRIADESLFSKDDRATLHDALLLALQACPEAVQMLIGTGIVEEDYFDDE